MALRVVALTAAALAGHAAGASLRQGARDDVASAKGGATDAAAKVERLLLDIDESVQKSGSDAELVYATLYSYDHQLEATLTGEMDKVSKDLDKLRGLQREQLQKEHQQDAPHAPANRRDAEAHHAAGVSLAQKKKGKVARAATGAGAEFRSALASVQQLVARAQRSAAANSTRGRGAPGNPDELAFSLAFTEAVLRIDADFTEKVRESMKRKAELVEVIRNARQGQHKTLEALLDLLRGRYRVEAAGADRDNRDDSDDHDDHDDRESDGDEEDDEDDAARRPKGLSFLQASATSHDHDQSQPSHQPKVSALQYQIEAALRKKEDTHAILLKIKDVLSKTAPVSADSVQGLLGELGGVLRSVHAEQSMADQAKKKCDSQKKHASLEELGLKTNMALMDAVQNHTQAAIQAAKFNLKTIVAKTKDLQLSTEEFSKIVAKTTATLEDQSQDRRTIMTAVEKARDIVGRLNSGGPAASALLERMLQELQAQELGERTYRASEVAFRGAFLSYGRSYLQLLRESRGHYESSLGALELYAEEVQSDAVAQADSLATGKELQKENKELCQGILRFYSHHKRRQQELTRMLQEVLPEVPVVLRGGSASTSPVHAPAAA